ncbi:MAG TPA: TIGR03960 family B12-binding radical SAM protein [Candidatus Hydrogenedentes bacterium]|nr:TIGR03960 family B12-binding radical SAM protein [Candidatus Hydrogenedentota bacterium]
MITRSDTAPVRLDDVLPRVERPSRYLGTEVNSVHKDAARIDLRIALAFPDLYDMGLGNLGLLILYGILNDLPWCWAERAYAPAPDMEAALRERGLPLFTNESKTPLGALDAIGFTLQSELTYTSVLNMLDLAKIPLRSADRTDAHPIVFAGGPTAFNPEPMAPFIDFFVIGDGEEAVLEIAEVLRAQKGKPRAETLSILARLEGLYAPAAYPFETLPDGRIVPALDAPKIVRRTVNDLEAARFPIDYIVPFTKLIHDRVGLEVMRGCTHGCRFCQAGMTSRPVRERSAEQANDLLRTALDRTGCEEASLVSLSTCDHSQARALALHAAHIARENDAAVSLPSLRLAPFAVDLADAISGLRRSGLTFAPEAATARLRAVINKWIPDEDLLCTAAEAFRRGWGHVKCYFMIGLPTERDEDIDAIVDLCKRTLAVGRSIARRAQINTGISTFVPKPFTPFQWAEQISIDEARRRQAILEKGFARCGGIKFGRHDPRSTFVEGLLSRADRRVADVIEAAWRRGARLDSSDEYLRFDAWIAAIEDAAYPAEESFRARTVGERLPWDHIDSLVSRAWLELEWKRAQELEHAPDCRHGECRACGVSQRLPELCQRMEQRSHDGSITDAAIALHALPDPSEPPTAQRLRFQIGRIGESRFLSHLEWMSAWIRTLRRAKAPLSYSQGFHAHPKITFATAAPVGEESLCDYMDVLLRERVDAEALKQRIIAVAPPDFRVFSVTEAPLNAPALMSQLAGFLYDIHAPGDAATVQERAAAIMTSTSIFVERAAKEKGKPPRAIDVRPNIARLDVRMETSGRVSLEAELRVIEGRGIRMRELLELLGLDPVTARFLKRTTFLSA